MASNPIHKGRNQIGALKISIDLPLCRACGTQYDSTNLTACRIDDDPRQFVPPTGQIFTKLGALHSDPQNYHLTFTQDEADSKVWSIRVEPNVGIGQRALLIKTPHGNILWDLVCYLDDPAVDKINELGGLSCIIISHPHFYTTWKDWSRTFNNVPVYVAEADREWLNRSHEDTALTFLTEPHTTILPGVTAIICGGHFPGSTALHTSPPNTSDPSLFHADTIHTIPNALTPDVASPNKHGRGHTSYTFMWSIPNAIPLSPDQILQIWRRLKGYEIEATYGFTTVRYRGGASIPERILESAKVCVRAMGWKEHEVLQESVD